MYNEYGKTSRKKLRSYMRNGFFLLFLLLTALPLCAQDLDISLFDDTPNIGRTAPPLESLRLTPPPAPDIRIDLDNTEEQPATPAQGPVAAGVTSPPSTDSSSGPLPALPSTHIDLSGTSPAPVVPIPNNPQQYSGAPLHDVSTFDIKGFSLAMPAMDALSSARKKGYRVTLTQESVPLFYATDYAYKCKRKGLVIPDEIKQCIKDYACHEKTRYISEAVLSKKNEIFQLYFTSNATENLLYKIIYINKGDNSLNFTRINKAIKQLRFKEFWNAVFEKFGYPDNQEKYIWGNPAKAYMTANMSGSNYDGRIIMEDVTLSNEDYFEAEDVEIERPPQHRFSF